MSCHSMSSSNASLSRGSTKFIRKTKTKNPSKFNKNIDPEEEDDTYTVENLKK